VSVGRAHPIYHHGHRWVHPEFPVLFHGVVHSLPDLLQGDQIEPEEASLDGEDQKQEY
jgi:hypothetical protein